jgi:hypothetical protein
MRRRKKVVRVQGSGFGVQEMQDLSSLFLNPEP